MPDFQVSQWDWTPPQGGIRLTEYLDNTGTVYQTGEARIMERTVYLYPDGTAALVGVPVLTYFYDGTTGTDIETLTPSWARAALVLNAFDWEMLTVCLEAL